MIIRFASSGRASVGNSTQGGFGADHRCRCGATTFGRCVGAARGEEYRGGVIVSPARSRSMLFGAAAADLVAVLVFAAVGRRSHEEGFSLLGVLEVAAPFLVGAVVGWLAGRVWREPLAWRSGLAVWLGTAVVGLALRALVLHRLPLSFVLVASVSLAVFLLGWRLLFRAGARLSRRS
jgi:hypothetical protein